MENMKTVVEFHLDGLSPELETKLREMIAAGKKPADVEFEINKVILANYMREHKVDLVVAEYEGSGDSGGVDNVTFFRDGHQVDEPQGRVPLVVSERIYQKEVKTIRIKTMEVGAGDAFSFPVYSALNLCGHGGWETNEGGYGEARFTLKNPQDEAVAVQLTHNAYITDVETYDHDL